MTPNVHANRSALLLRASELGVGLGIIRFASSATSIRLLEIPLSEK